MSVRTTVVDGIASKCALYDSTNDVAFGPIFDDEHHAEAFLAHLELIGERDPRVIPAADLAVLKQEWEQQIAALDDLPAEFVSWLARQHKAPAAETMNQNTLDVWVRTWRADTHAGPTDVELYGAGAR